MTPFSRLFSGSAAPEIRTATSADAPEMARLHAGAFHRGWSVEEFERLLAERAAIAHVLTVPRGRMLGFVLSHMVPPESEILSIAIGKSAQGRGHGRALLTHHLGRLAALGVTASFLEVEAGNAAALALYRRAGYGEVGRRKAYYAGPDGAADALVMRRDF